MAIVLEIQGSLPKDVVPGLRRREKWRQFTQKSIVECFNMGAL
jgi:hypothetical protein